MTQSIAKSLPHDAEAEKIVLGAMLLKNELIDQVAADRIESSLFYAPANRSIWANLKRRRSKPGDFDMQVFLSFLLDLGELENCGGRVAVLELADVPTIRMFHANLEALRRKAERRALYEAVTAAQSAVFDESLSIDSVVADLDAVAGRIMDSVAPTRSTVWKDHLLDFQEKFQEKLAAGGGLPGISTGFAPFDEAFNGWEASRVYVLSGRPGTGKTALMMNFIEHVCNEGIPAGVFSLEMSAYQMVVRALSNSSKIDSRRLARADLGKPEYAKLMAGMQKQIDWPLQLDDRPSLRPIDIEVTVRKWVKEHGVKIVFIDYLQLIAGATGKEEERIRIDEASKAMKRIAKRHDIAVACLAQMKRLTGRGDPTYNDLKGSGSMEEDADVVILLNCSEEDRKLAVASIDAIIEKARDGSAGKHRLRFTKPYMQFEVHENQDYTEEVDQ